jgi:hypothetical protein
MAAISNEDGTPLAASRRLSPAADQAHRTWLLCVQCEEACGGLGLVRLNHCLFLDLGVHPRADRRGCVLINLLILVPLAVVQSYYCWHKR